STLRERLAEYPLVAVRRDENAGSPYPHPCFCATTVEFWHAIGGTWHLGDRGPWRDPQGKAITDVGANLYTILERERIEWEPLRRTNTHDLHPLFYAVY